MNLKPSGQTSRSTTPPVRTSRYTAQEWDEVRGAFCSSILADTSLTSLAQNLEGSNWPIPGPGEVPSAYIHMSFNELRENLAIRGQPPSIADHLIDILKETLAFDDPFGEMVTHGQETATADNPITKNLEKLKIPAEFPVALSALSPETKMFCQLEGIKTIGELALASQRMAGRVIVGGDFRELLNALSNVDELTVARFLPYRVGFKGLHYIEGLAKGVCSQPVDIQVALANRLKQPLSKAALDRALTVTEEQLTRARFELQTHAAAIQMFCQTDYLEVQKKIETGILPRRLVSHLGDPLVEAVVADLLAPTVEPEASGLFTRIINWFRR